MLLITVSLASLPLLAPATSPQTLSVVVTEGDLVPGVGAITDIEGVRIADDGTTLIEVDTDNPDRNASAVLLRDSSLFLRAGQPLAAPAGATLDDFDGIAVRRGGSTAVLLGIDGTASTEAGLYVDGQLVLREGDVSTATGFSPGTTYERFVDVKFGGSPETLLLLATVDDPNIITASDAAFIRLDRDPATGVWSETVLRKEGDVLPPVPQPIAFFEQGPEESAFNSAGQLLFHLIPGGLPVSRSAIFLDSTMLLRRGDPSPVPGRDWGGLNNPEMDLNASGSWVVKTLLDSSDTSTDDVIVRDGEIYRQAGNTLPAIAPFVIQDFGGSVGVWVTDAGDVVWFGDWNNPDTSRDEGLFINDRLVLQENVTQVDGFTIGSLSNASEQLHVSPSGSHILVVVTAFGPGGPVELAIRIETELGSAFCTSLPNSTGQIGTLTALGTDVAAENGLSLLASGMPPGQFGIFAVSPQAGSVPTGNGILCLSGPLGRFNQPGQILEVSAAGTFGMPVDLTAIPTPNAFVPVLAGDTYHFQAWHRDGIPPNSSSNLTNGLRVVFQ